jgi:hypothetical protein
MKSTKSNASSAEDAASGLKASRSRILIYIGILLFSLFSTGAMVNFLQCQTKGCSPLVPDHLSLNADSLSPNGIQAVSQGQIMDMWLEIGDTGVFSPSTSVLGTELEMGDGQKILFLDKLAEKGYLAIRVPHHPSDNTSSSLLPGIPPGEPDAVTFSYYSPPSSASLTTVAVDVTRRADLETLVNAQFPITDGKSHWEVWWLPEGETFPIPDQPFRLDAESWPPPLAIRFRIDFGAGKDAEDCAGCPLGLVSYNGYLFTDPITYDIRFIDPSIPEPPVAFGIHCSFQDTPVFPTIIQYITPSEAFTHEHCLENWDTVTRTFTIDTASSQGWDYTYYWQGTGFGAIPIPAGDPPFTVEVGPIPSGYEPGTLGLLAIYTPTITAEDALRETFLITATSTVSAEVTASSFSMALGPGYTLDEGEPPQPPQKRIFLPVILNISY